MNAVGRRWVLFVVTHRPSSEGWARKNESSEKEWPSGHFFRFSGSGLPVLQPRETEDMESLSTERIRALLEKKDRWIALSTYGPDGFPHTVPIGYFLVEDKLVLGCLDETQKVKNIERNDKVSLLWENGRGEDSLTGILIRGHARIVRDDSERLELKGIACMQRGQEKPSTVSPGSVYIEVTPVKTISWHRPTGRRK